MIIGPQTAKLFAQELDVEFLGKAQKQVNGLAIKGWIAGINSEFQEVKLGDYGKSFGEIYKDNDFQGEPSIAASITKYGKGKIAAAYLNLGERYLNSATTVCRDFLSALVRELFPNPIVQINGSHNVDVTINKIHGKLAINLVNTSGPHADKNVNVFDQIPSIGPLQVVVNFEKKPSMVTLEPEGRKLEFSYQNNKITLILSELEIHSVIVVE